MDTAVLVWNGSSVAGNMVIQAFLEKLPVSDHQIISLDAQPVHGMLEHFEFFLFFLC
jgi:NTF2-related export protein 1/2